MSNYDSNDITPAHLAENDFVRVTYNSAYSDKPQSFEGTVTTVGGSFGSVTVDPHEDMDDGEPRIYVLGNDVSVDTGYGDRRISDMTNPNIHIEILNEEADEDDSESETDARSMLDIIFEEDDPNDLYDLEHGDPVTVTYTDDDGVERVLHTGTMTSTQVLGMYGTKGLIWVSFDHLPGKHVCVEAGGDVTVYDSDDSERVIGTDALFQKRIDDDATECEPEPEMCTDGGHDFGELLEASADGDHSEALSRDEVANLEDETPVTLAYRSTQDTDKCINATVNKAWQGAYYAVVFLTTEDDKERTLHAYKSGRGTLYMDHDAPGGRRLSKLSHAYIVRPESEPEPVTDGGSDTQYPEPRRYKDLVESEETPKPLAEGEHVESDAGVRLARLEGVHSEEFVVSAGTINNVVMDREEIALLAELAGFEVEER